MSDTPIEMVRQMASLSNADAREAFLYQHPVLLDPASHEAIAVELEAIELDEQLRLAPLLEHLRQTYSALNTYPQDYPIGMGPIEGLWFRVEQGEIDKTYAEQLARQAAELLSPLYVRVLNGFAIKRAHRGEWRPAVGLQRLLLVASAQMANSPEVLEARQDVVLNWIEIASIALNDVPDGRLYQQACALGEQLLAEARAAAARPVLGELLQRLGVLHLDPYTAGRTNLNYEQQISLWQRRLYQELGEQIFWIAEDELRMPTPAEALQLAEQYFRQAIEYRENDKKGRTLKALVQTLEWQGIVGQPGDETELVAVCHEALKYLDLRRHPHQRLEVLATLERRGHAIDPNEMRLLMQVPLEQYVEQLGPVPTMALVSQAAQLFEDINAPGCLELLHDASDLFDQYGDEGRRSFRWNLMLRLIRRTLAPDLAPRLLKGDLSAAAQSLQRRAQKMGWDKTKLGAGLVALAMVSTGRNEEAVGLEILSAAIQTAPLFFDEYAHVIAFLYATLQLGAGVNAYNAADWAGAVECYAHAIPTLLNLRLHGMAMDMVTRLDDLAQYARENPQVIKNMTIALATHALRLEKEVGDPATRAIQQLCRNLFAAMSLKAVNPEVAILLMQCAKGLRFAAALHAGAYYDYSKDDHGLQLLQKIAALGGPHLPAQDPTEVLDENLLVNAYTIPNQHFSGDTQVERLVNLQHNYDEHVNQMLLASVPSEPQTLMYTNHIQTLLDERTVLINYYFAASHEGDITVYGMLFTKETIRMSGINQNFPSSQVAMKVGEQEVLINPLVLTIAETRRQVQAPSGPWPVASAARQNLKHDLRTYLGHFVEQLEELRQAGKDHLCIVPHGPLHFYPFHLLGEAGTTLAERWTVTYLPNLYLLTKQTASTGQRQPRARQMVALGLSFTQDNPFNLGQLTNSTTEAHRVAELFETEPLLEQQATKAALLEALQTSRYVHLSTHGRHNVAAPAFQCLYLSPDSESDGRLYAYELLRLDLRGLEVLTLSACETALGRFGIADNLRGLPASFLLAGVSTIVGTLWEVDPKPTEHFFSALYAQLKSGVACGCAFLAAQESTRKQYPKYRDWGAFYMIGKW